MEQEFLGGRTTVAATEHQERSKYVNHFRDLGYDLLDTHDEHRLYGLINKKCQIVMPNCPAPSSFGEYAPGVLAQSFVVKQFNEFKEFYNFVSSEAGVTPPELVADLTPTKSFLDFEQEYLAYQQTLLRPIFNFVVQDMQSTGTPPDFMRFYELVSDCIFTEEMSNYPITKSGFAVSPSCDIHTTGIYVDIGKQFSPHLDELKVSMMKDDGFQCYVEYANKFGFYVDAHNPWRLIANVKSAPMQEAILNNRPSPRFYDFYSNEFLFKVALDDIEAVKQFYKKAYIEFVRNYIDFYPGATENPQSVLPSVQTPRFWIETTIINKFKEMELGLYHNPRNPNHRAVSGPTMNSYYEIFNNSVDIYEQYGLSSISGTSHYLMDFFSKVLKLRLYGLDKGGKIREYEERLGRELSPTARTNYILLLLLNED